jgi:hypothetical protein
MRSREIFSPAQCRAARGLLDWSPAMLARRARLEPEAIKLYERGEGDLSKREIASLGAVLNDAGVIALAGSWAGEGVRINRSGEPRTPFGSEDLQDVLGPADDEDDVADTPGKHSFPSPRQPRGRRDEW